MATRDLKPAVVQPVRGPGVAYGRPTITFAKNEYLRLVPYARSKVRMMLYWFLVVVSGGLVLVISIWFPLVFTHLARMRLPYSSLGRAHFVLIHAGGDGVEAKWVEVPVHHKSSKERHFSSLRKKGNDLDKAKLMDDDDWVWFEFQHQRYVYKSDKGEFECYIAAIDESLHKINARMVSGLQPYAVTQRMDLFGPNITELEQQGWLLRLLNKLVHPLYLFQLFTTVLWFFQEHYARCGLILGISTISVSWEVLQELKTARSERLVSSKQDVHVVRTVTNLDGTESPRVQKVPVHELVPGDIVALKAKERVPADMVLISGSCIVDESKLSGVIKQTRKRHVKKIGDGSQTTNTSQSRKGQAKGGGRDEESTSPQSGSVSSVGEQISLASRRLHVDSFVQAGSATIEVFPDTSKETSVDPVDHGERDNVVKDENCLAVVVSTGYATVRGDMLRRGVAKLSGATEYERDTYRFLVLFSVIAIARFVIRLLITAEKDKSIESIIFGSLDVVAIAVPPALPLVLSAVANMSLKRLVSYGIVCSDPDRVAAYAQVSCVCFDKTGTLTEKEMTFSGVDPFVEGTFSGMSTDPAEYTDEVMLVLSCCHELMGPSSDHSSNPVDRTMLAFTNGAVEDPEESDKGKYIAVIVSPTKSVRFGVCVRFPFDPSSRYAGVVVEEMGTDRRWLLIKGAPDVVAKKCSNWDDAMDAHIKEMQWSYYTLGMAIRELSSDADLTDRFALEKDVRFAGLALFNERARSDSNLVLQKLRASGIDVRMLTGDAGPRAMRWAQAFGVGIEKPLTLVDTFQGEVMYIEKFNASLDAVNDYPSAVFEEKTNMLWDYLPAGKVSRLLVDRDVTITGPALKLLQQECNEETVRHIVQTTKLFALMDADQKQWLIEQLMLAGHEVAMVGDGVNDIGALRVANVGLALATHEASTVSPFTSTRKDINDVLKLLRCGRHARASTFVAFKFIAICTILQFVVFTTLDYLDLSFTGNKMTWSEIGMVMGLGLALAFSQPADELSSQTPPLTFISPSNFSSVIVQVWVLLIFLVGIVVAAHYEPEYCSNKDGLAWLDGDRSKGQCDVFRLFNTLDSPYSYETTYLWLFTNFQVIAIAMAMTVPDEFRGPMLSNRFLWLVALALGAINAWLVMDETGTLDSVFPMMRLPIRFRIQVFVLFGAHLLIAVITERIVQRAASTLRARWRAALHKQPK